MGRWTIARVDGVHVVTMTSSEVNAVDGAVRIGMNEVQVGVPVPAIPLAVTRHALSPSQLRETLLMGALYGPTDAKARGLVDEIVAAEDLLPRACARARSIAPDSLTAYAAVKTHLLAPTLAASETTREQVNREFLDVWFSESGQRRLRDTRDRLLRRS